MAASKDTQSEQSYLDEIKSNIECRSADDFLRVWEHYDADGNGYIEDKELIHFFSELMGTKDNPEAISAEKLAGYMEKYDKNLDGKIEMKELAEILRPEEKFLLLFRTNELRSSDEFMKTWQKYDTDKSGYIEAGELKSFIRDLLENPRPGSETTEDAAEPLTEETLARYTETMLKLFDRNGDGKLEINEMARLLPVRENFLMRFEGSLLSRGPGKKDLSKDEFNRVFGHYDRDGNGTIEGEELIGFLEDLLEHEQRSADNTSLKSWGDYILDKCDVNNDGRLQKDELARFLLPSPRSDKA